MSLPGARSGPPASWADAFQIEAVPALSALSAPDWTTAQLAWCGIASHPGFSGGVAILLGRVGHRCSGIMAIATIASNAREKARHDQVWGGGGQGVNNPPRATSSICVTGRLQEVTARSRHGSPRPHLESRVFMRRLSREVVGPVDICSRVLSKRCSATRAERDSTTTDFTFFSFR